MSLYVYAFKPASKQQVKTFSWECSRKPWCVAAEHGANHRVVVVPNYIGEGSGIHTVQAHPRANPHGVRFCRAAWSTFWQAYFMFFRFFRIGLQIAAYDRTLMTPSATSHILIYIRIYLQRDFFPKKVVEQFYLMLGNSV